VTSLSNFKNPKISDRESFHVRIQTQCSTRVSRVVSDVSSETREAIAVRRVTITDLTPARRSSANPSPNATAVSPP